VERMTAKPLVIVAGSYEGGLYGWSVDIRKDDTLLGAAELSWAFGAHMGAVKTVAVDAAGEWLATGGVDEYIKLYTVSNRREKGELSQHTGSVTALSFYKSSHLLSASQDGTICIWNTSSWHCEHVLGGHKDAVTCLSIHPSGRMALSGSKDRTLRLWNLVEGRCAFITKPSLPKSVDIECVEWSPSGSRYVVVAGGHVLVYDASQTGKPTPVVNHVQRCRVNACCFVGDERLALGGDDGVLQLLDAATGKVLRSVEGPCKARLKGVSVMPAQAPSLRPLVLAATSNGSVHVWDVTNEEKSDAECLVASITVPGATSRLTCLAVAAPVTTGGPAAPAEVAPVASVELDGQPPLQATNSSSKRTKSAASSSEASSEVPRKKKSATKKSEPKSAERGVDLNAEEQNKSGKKRRKSVTVSSKE